ncbi:MAG TPA: tRNA (adenosine(37)-N6)-threonylcarbamoyltransferase complex ATPase subunit type 1 TsaE [Candidatus Binatia bacterium]|jgi:tRNA threonylcarbamoyladenosine biosynthesis protein TsaE|nr:tRNA (adenosine(37)-N6)-threonylcarbamoyltransferase complex ATPase subunit type 1 TsaE [Candidatus Binatia bacterium]
MGSWSVVSKSSRQTMGWGRKLAKLVQGGEIIGLVGELGTGKTCFVRGFAEGLEVGEDAWIRSPTFTLINEYHARLPIYHIDLYRIGARHELEGLNLREYLYSDGVSLIEWFENLPAADADEFLEIRIAHGGGSKRQLTFVGHGERYEKIVQKFKRSKVQAVKKETRMRRRVR